jgi:serine/threonine-protein kinase RsbW
MPKQRWIWQCDRIIPSDAADGRRIVDEILQQLQARNWSEDDLFGVHLAFEEALVNAISHGNKSDRRKQVEISCRISPQTVRIEIADQGQGFDPSTVPDPTDPRRLETPGGRGVTLIKAFMSRVKYNAAGNRIVLEKNRSTAPSPQ